MANQSETYIPFSKIKYSILKILKDEGFIRNVELSKQELVKKLIRVQLKYDGNGRPAISNLKRISRPGKRMYKKRLDVPKVLNGFGVGIFSTNGGVVTGREARLNNLGGEYLVEVY